MTESQQYLTDKHCVVTGGGRGIGAAIAEELARLGATVTIMGRDRGRLERELGQLKARFGGEHAAEPCDVTDQASVSRAFDAARVRHGHPWVLVNNAGAAMSARFTETTREAWDDMLATNLTSAFLCCQQVLPAMLDAGSGRIVNVGSIASVKGAARLAAYTAAKHGLIGLTRALASETVKRGITVNAVCPGYTDTGMAQMAVDNLVTGRGVTPDEAKRMILGTIPRGRLIEPAEVASAVGWLCSPGASAVTGQAIVLAGGEP